MLCSKQLPRHVAIIMDGNGRWAKERNKLRTEGHKAGADVAIDTVLYAERLGIKYITLFVFSIENWNRPKYEVDFLLKLLSNTLNNKAMILKENGIRLEVIGDMSGMSSSVLRLINKVKKTTSDCCNTVCTVALSYGGRQEIELAAEKFKLSNDGSQFKDHLLTSFLPDPDLLIRTGGERRISNFILYGLAYTELYFLDKYWPDFTCADFKNAIDEFERRRRRFGKLN